MDSQLTLATQLIEMNQAVRLLWRHDYSLQDLGASVIVDDPVSRVVGSQIETRSSKQFAIRSYADARRFVDARN